MPKNMPKIYKRNPAAQPVTSRASKINTRVMGRGRVPTNRIPESNKGRRV